ncbi:MAG: HigA family addiction module antitoxin [Lysobacterales bacterium]
MHNPPHQGEFMRSVYLGLLKLVRALAESPAVSPSTLNRAITDKRGISPDIALRLSKALSRPAESWLAMQGHYDLWQTQQRTNPDKVQHVQFATAKQTLESLTSFTRTPLRGAALPGCHEQFNKSARP